jgi:uncharacterized membrane protein
MSPSTAPADSGGRARTPVRLIARLVSLYLVYPVLVFAAFAFPSAPPVVFVPAVAINAFLAILFARTLLPGREPMISWFARLERGNLEADLVTYTRRLTWLWVVFFVVMAGIAGALAAFGSGAAWAWYAGVANYLLVGALLIGEYVYRCRRFAHYHHLTPREYWHVVRAALRRSAS